MNNRFLTKTFLAVSALILLNLTGCSDSQTHNSTENQSTAPVATESETVTDIESVFKELSSKLTFEDSMEIVSDDYSEMLLAIPASMYEDCILYMGSGATAEELLIFKVSSPEQVESIKNSLQTHIEDQKAAFEGYDPEELKILSEAYIASNDSIVICCVSQDAAAAKAAISSYCN